MRSSISTKVVEMWSTGNAAVAGSSLIRWQTSNPLTSGSLTSRMINAGFSAASSSASAPVSPSRIRYPALRRIFATACRFASSSSMISTVSGGRPAISTLRVCRGQFQASVSQGLPHRHERLLRRHGGLGKNRRSPGGEPPALLFTQDRRGIEDDGNTFRRIVGLQPLQDLEPGHIRHDHVKEDHVGPLLPRPPESLLTVRRLQNSKRPLGG